MITVAVAARTMDRQARYRSLMSMREYTLLPALDCHTLARHAKSRPVDVLVFDLQKPAMPATEWLTIISSDPELKSLPTVWVGRDVLPEVLGRIRILPGSVFLPARPDSRTLTEAISSVVASGKKTSRNIQDSGSPGAAQWRPGEDIIDQALSIFDQPAEKTGVPSEATVPDRKAQEWSVAEVSAPSKQDAERAAGDAEPGKIESADGESETPREDSSIMLDAEEIGSGDFGMTTVKKTDSSTTGGVVQEKFLSITPAPGAKDKKVTSQDWIDQVTNEVLTQLAGRLAEELVSRIDPELVRKMVEKKLFGTQGDAMPEA